MHFRARDAYKFDPKHKSYGGPKYTTDELAALFKVKVQTIAKLMANDPNGPRPIVKHKKSGASLKTYYDLHEVQRWWKKLHANTSTSE